MLAEIVDKENFSRLWIGARYIFHFDTLNALIKLGIHACHSHSLSRKVSVGISYYWPCCIKLFLSLHLHTPDKCLRASFQLLTEQLTESLMWSVFIEKSSSYPVRLSMQIV